MISYGNDMIGLDHRPPRPRPPRRRVDWWRLGFTCFVILWVGITAGITVAAGEASPPTRADGTPVSTFSHYVLLTLFWFTLLALPLALAGASVLAWLLIRMLAIWVRTGLPRRVRRAIDWLAPEVDE